METHTLLLTKCQRMLSRLTRLLDVMPYFVLILVVPFSLVRAGNRDQISIVGRKL